MEGPSLPASFPSRPSRTGADPLACSVPQQEEAFSVWDDWAFLYPPRSAPRALLQGIAASYWLVSVVCHDFKHAGGLADFLLGA